MRKRIISIYTSTKTEQMHASAFLKFHSFFQTENRRILQLKHAQIVCYGSSSIGHHHFIQTMRVKEEEEEEEEEEEDREKRKHKKLVLFFYFRKVSTVNLQTYMAI